MGLSLSRWQSRPARPSGYHASSLPCESGIGPTLPSAASAEHGSYLGISCRQWDGARWLKMTQSRHSFEPLLDHLVGLGEQYPGNFEPELPGGLEVDDKLEFGGLLDGQTGGLLALRLARRSLALRPAHSRCHQFVTRIPKASAISSPPQLLRLLPAGAVAGWVLHPLESAALPRRTPGADIRSIVIRTKGMPLYGGRPASHQAFVNASRLNSHSSDRAKHRPLPPRLQFRTPELAANPPTPRHPSPLTTAISCLGAVRSPAAPPRGSA